MAEENLSPHPDSVLSVTQGSVDSVGSSEAQTNKISASGNTCNLEAHALERDATNLPKVPFIPGLDLVNSTVTAGHHRSEMDKTSGEREAEQAASPASTHTIMADSPERDVSRHNANASAERKPGEGLLPKAADKAQDASQNEGSADRPGSDSDSPSDDSDHESKESKATSHQLTGTEGIAESLGHQLVSIEGATENPSHPYTSIERLVENLVKEAEAGPEFEVDPDYNGDSERESDDEDVTGPDLPGISPDVIKSLLAVKVKAPEPPKPKAKAHSPPNPVRDDEDGASEDDGEEEREGDKQNWTHTKNEGNEDYELPQVTLPHEYNLKLLGQIEHIIRKDARNPETVVIIKPRTSETLNVLDIFAEGTPIFREDRILAGKINEVISSTNEPYFKVGYPKSSDIDNLSLSEGMSIFYAEGLAFRLREVHGQRLFKKGTDASNIHDEPALGDDVSDEEEVKVKTKKQKKKKAKKPSAEALQGGRGGHRGYGNRGRGNDRGYGRGPVRGPARPYHDLDAPREHTTPAHYREREFQYNRPNNNWGSFNRQGRSGFAHGRGRRDPTPGQDFDHRDNYAARRQYTPGREHREEYSPRGRYHDRDRSRSPRRQTYNSAPRYPAASSPAQYTYYQGRAATAYSNPTTPAPSYNPFFPANPQALSASFGSHQTPHWGYQPGNGQTVAPFSFPGSQLPFTPGSGVPAPTTTGPSQSTPGQFNFSSLYQFQNSNQSC